MRFFLLCSYILRNPEDLLQSQSFHHPRCLLSFLRSYEGNLCVSTRGRLVKDSGTSHFPTSIDSCNENTPSLHTRCFSCMTGSIGNKRKSYGMNFQQLWSKEIWLYVVKLGKIHTFPWNESYQVSGKWSIFRSFHCPFLYQGPSASANQVVLSQTHFGR